MSSRAFTFDTFDTLRSGDPATLEVLGRTHSRLVNWADFDRQLIAGDLAASWEQPEPGVWLFHLAPAARWHDRPPLNGRPLTAEDCVAHLRRAMELAASIKLPLIQRAHDYATISSVTTPSPGLLRVETTAPDPFLFHTFASRFALVQAPETVTAFEAHWAEVKPEQVAGSGPFVYSGERDGALRFAAHRTGHRPPLLNALAVIPPFDPVRAYMDGGATQVITRDRRDAGTLTAAGSAATLCFEEQPVVLGCFAGAPPWEDERLRRALSGALNRQTLAQLLFGGRAAPAGPLAPVFGQFAANPEHLASSSGFRSDVDEDRRDARALWSAAGGPALGTITIDFPSVFDPLYSASSVVVQMLNEALGTAQFRAAVETYTTISKKAAAHAYGAGSPSLWLGWGPAFVEPDPSRWLIETYSARRGNGFATTGFREARLDDDLDALAAEFRLDERRKLVAGISDRLLNAAGGGILNLLVQRSEVFSQPGWSIPPPTPWATQHLGAVIAHA